MTLSQLMTNLLVPPGILLILAFIILLFFRKKKGLRRLLLLVWGVAFYLLSVPYGAQHLLNFLQNQYKAIHVNSSKDLKGGQVIVVLGGGIRPQAPDYAEDTVSLMTLERLRYAAALIKDTNKPVLLSGGVVVKGHDSEAEIMKRVLEKDFNAKTNYWLEDESKNTNDNAIYTAAMLEHKNLQKIILVTHGWHMPRAVALFEKRGIKIIPAPTGQVHIANPNIKALNNWFPSYEAFFFSSIVIKEILGIGLSLVMT